MKFSNQELMETVVIELMSTVLHLDSEKSCTSMIAR